MPPTDLDGRLRHALTLPSEPAASRESLASVVAALPRYRARRRAVLAAGASALGVLVLTLGLLVGLRGSTPPRLAGPAGAGPSLRPPPASTSCVRVQVGVDVARCVGQVTAGNDKAAAATGFPPLGRNEPASGSGTPTPSGTVRARVGERVAVSLPRLPGISWHHVTLTVVAFTAPPPGTFARSLPIHVDSGTRRTIAVVPHAKEGKSVLVATGSASCMAGPQCASTIRQWSITIDAS